MNFEPLTPATLAVPMGEGIINYRVFLNALRESGCFSPVAHEIYSPLRGGGAIENLGRCARLFLHFVADVGQ